MKYLKISTILLIIFCVGFSYAQGSRLGIIGGINMANFSYDDDTEAESLTVFGVGAVFSIPAGKKMQLCFQPMYLQKGASEESGDMIYTLAYIEMPILIKLMLGENDTRPYIFGGPTVGMLMSAKVEIDGLDDDFDVKDVLESLDYGLCVGAGLDIAMGNNKLFIEASYNLGLADIVKGGTVDIMGEQDVPDQEVKTTGIKIMAGITMPLGQ